MSTAAEAARRQAPPGQVAVLGARDILKCLHPGFHAPDDDFGHRHGPVEDAAHGCDTNPHPFGDVVENDVVALLFYANRS
jgi:hypothetical protein